MVDTATRPDIRVNFRVPSELFARVEQIAKDRYEGKISMAAREAFRQFVADEPTEQVEGEQAA